MEKKQKAKAKYNINKRTVRQDIKNIFIENGFFYFFKRIGFINWKNILFGKIGIFILDKKYSYDIDEEIDFETNEIAKKIRKCIKETFTKNLINFNYK